MKKRWKSLIAWALIITIIGGYGNTALAAGLNDGISSETGTGDIQPEDNMGTDTGSGGGSETGTGNGESSGKDDAETGGSGTEAGGTETGGSTGETGTETDGSTDGTETDADGSTKEPETEEEEEAVAESPIEAVAYEPYWENGNYSNLVVFVDFADTTHQHDNEYGECFKANPDTTFKYFNGDEANPRGMRQYLYNISYGQLRVENIFPQYDAAANTITPYTLSRESAYYVNNESAMVTEILEQLNASGQLQENMNLHLDSGTQNIVDNLNIVAANNEAELFVNHKAGYAGNEQVSGCLVRDYTIINEKDIYFGASESGVIIHEFLHTVGYPDLYRQGENSGVPVGSWDIMANVNRRVQYPLAYLRSAYTKWFEIPSVTESQTGLSLYAASKTTAETRDQQALILKTDYSDTEFFVVEYRKKGEQYVNNQYSNGYEMGIPGSGLIVYRVNTASETNYVGTTDMLYLFRPGDSYRDDGRESGKGNYDQAHLSQEVGRTSYGSSNFEDSLSEGAITYSDGKNSGIVISNVGSSSGDQITFDVTFYEEDEGAVWKTVATEKDGEVTTQAASCMDKDGNFYYILKKGNANYLYQCKDGAFTRLGTAPAGSGYKLVQYGGKLYVGYLNDKYVVKLARWNGSSWQELYTAPRQANEISMTSDSKGVYLAYANTDGTRVYAVSYTAAGVAELGSQVAASTGYAANASIAAENGTIVVMYREAFNNGRIFVKQYNSIRKSWSDVGSQTFSANSGIIKIQGGKVYLMKNGTTYGNNTAYVYVYDLKVGGAWKQVGSNAYADSSIVEMDLCFTYGEPYVVYMSGSELRVTEVKHLIDNQWTNLGGSIAREDITGLAAYCFGGQIYVTYLNTVSNKVSVKVHASESTGVQEGLLISPELTTVDGKNPFQVISEHAETESGISAFRQGLFENSFRDQLADTQACELYDLLVEKYVTSRLSGAQTVNLKTPVTFQAHAEGNYLVPDEGDQGLAGLANSFHLAYGAFYMDNPSVFWMQGLGYSLGDFSYKNNNAGGYTVTVTSISFTVKEYYSGASKQISAYDAAVKKAKSDIEAGLIEADRYDQVKAIHDYLCERLEYNYAAADDLNASNYGYAHTSSTAFLGYNGKKSVVCEGYAKAFKVLCDQWGIPCVLVIGDGGTPGYAGPHMWNYVQMEDGNWYGVDATWDDQTSGIRSEYFLAGSNTPGFGKYTFAQEHVQDMYITTGEEYPFVYPELAESIYTPFYQGKVVNEAGGKWLYIDEMESEEPLSDADIVRLIRRNAPKGPFAGIRITRKNGEKVIPANLVNEAIPHLVRNGKLHFAFADQTESANRVIRWELTAPRRALQDLNGSVTAARGASGRWNLTFSDTGFPAKTVSLMYADSRMTEFYQLLPEESKEEQLPVYFYTPAMENGERMLALEGYYRYLPIPEEEADGGLHSLFISDAAKLEQGITYTVETSRYDWRLEYGYQEEADGTVLYYTSEEELITALDGLGIRDTNIRISSEGEEQPEVIVKELLAICVSKGLNLEYVRREEEDLAYGWNLKGLKAPADGEWEDFDLRVDMRMQGEDLPVEFLERTYIQVTPGQAAPDCEEVSLKLYQEGISSRFAGTGNISLWQKNGDSLTYLRTADRDPREGNWVSFTLNPISETSGNEIYVLSSQSKYGWQSLVEENGDWKVIYIENRTGKRVIGWEIIEGRKCYFDSEGYLCQGPVKIGNTWYLFGDYKERTQGILTGYQTYPEQKPSHAYYANTSGVLQKGWQKISNVWHYFSPEEASYGEEIPSIQQGYWVIIGEDAGEMAGRRYYFKNNTTLLKNWQTIDKKKYFFTTEGYARTGWYPNSSTKNAYYLNDLGQMVTGYVEIAEGEEIYHCFFNSSGIRQYGWQKSGNTWHYFQTDTKAADYGREIASVNTSGYWYEMDGNTYYFLNNTRLATGWQTISGGRYYFDGQGKMYTGTKKIGSAFYHFRTEDGQKGILGTGLFVDDEKTYYANSSGVLQRGWQKIEGIWRFFDHETGEEEKGKVETNYWAAVYDEAGKIIKISYFTNGTKIATGWQTIEGRRYYFDGNGILKTGFFKVGSNTYYGRVADTLAEYPGQVVTGEQEIDGASYYFGSNYAMLTGWQKVGGVWCYFSTEPESPARGQKQDVSGPVVEGSWHWYTVNGERYCFRSNSTLLKGWQTINGKRYYLNPSTGAATTGKELKIGSYTYYFDADGVMQKNVVVNGYGYNANGYKVKGWQKLAGEWHYFDAQTWQEVAAERKADYWITLTDAGSASGTYYFKNNASLLKGWQTVNGKRYYFDPKTGVLRTGDENGLYAIGANKYYLGQDGVLRYGWIREQEGKVYYANTSGVLLGGWQKIENLWYYFDRQTRRQDLKARVEDDYFATARDGEVTNTYYFVNGTSLAKGWQTIKGCKYYFDTSTGVLKTGFFQVGKAWYYFNEDRTPMTGWWENPDTGKTYYFNTSGQAVTGWQTIGGARYYFDANGVMQTQRTLVGKVYYFFGPDGKMRTGFVKYCDTTYYFNSKGQMLKGWQTIDGQRYYFDSEGSMQLGFSKIGTSTYYFDEKRATLGRMLKGEQRIGESTYYFNSSGVLLYGWQKVNNVWRFFDLSTGEERETEIALSGWATISISDTRIEKSFINNGTTILKGWQTVEGKRRYFDSNGFLWTREKGWLTVSGNRFYCNQDGSVYQGFLEEINADGTKSIYYLNANGQMLKGWQTIKVDGVSGKYYLDPSSGAAWMGHKKIGNNWYYLDPNQHGKMATGYLETLENGVLKGYYYNTSGVRQTGWQKVGGEWRYFDPAEGTRCDVTVGEDYWATVTLSNGVKERAFIRNGSSVLKGWQAINGKRYYFDGNGFQWTEDKGWLIIGSNRFYFDAKNDNSVHKGFLNLKDENEAETLHTYYLNGSGQALKGWQTIKVDGVNGKYYLDASTGELYKGHRKVGSSWYYFDPEKNGKMAVGHIQDEKGDSYYYNTNGTLLTGWRKLTGEKDYRYFDGAGDKENGGRIGVERKLEQEITTGVTGKKTYTYYWYTIKDETCKVNGSKYCFQNNSTQLKNRQSIDGKYYWFHSSTGALYTGYFAIGQNRYRSNADGSVYTGFDPEDPESSGDIYYYNAYGQRVTGWQTIAANRYYFNANGIMLKGICWIGNTRYVFHPQNGRMITDSVEIDGKTYYANTNGTLKTGWQKVYNKSKKVYENYYFGNDGQRATGWLSISGKLYYFNEDGIMQTGFQENIPVLERNGETASYYFNTSGVLQKGWFRLKVDGVTAWCYFARENGERLSVEQDENRLPVAKYQWYQVTENGKQNTYCIYNNATLLKNYQNVGGKRYYFDAATGALQAGWFQAGKTTCYGDPDTGAITAGIQEIDGAAYYLNSNGVPQKGWQKVNKKTYYFDSAGQLVTGWLTLSGKDYYLDGDGVMQTGLKEGIPSPGTSGETGTYYFNNSGVMQKGWFRFTENKAYVWKYFGADGKKIEPVEERVLSPKGESVKGNPYRWYVVEEPGETDGETVRNWYCIQKNATVLKGFFNIGTWRYYFDSKTGVLRKGSFQVGNAWYYSEPESGAISRSGLLLKSGEGENSSLTHYDVNGKRYTGGWINLKDADNSKIINRYYFYGTGKAASGFTKIGKYDYYFDPDTCVLQKNASDKVTGVNLEGMAAFYYTGKYEYLLSGWQKIKGVWYYFDPVTKEGSVPEKAEDNWVSLDGNQYYFIKGATLAKNWQTIKVDGVNGKYYFNGKGVLQKGLFAVGANWYYTNEETGKAEAGFRTFEEGPFAGKTCYFDANGLMKKGWISLKVVDADTGKTVTKYYYLNANGIMLKGISWIGNIRYLLHPETGERITTSVEIAGKTYYGDSARGKEGRLLLGWQKVGSKSYYYGTDGQRYTGWQLISGKWYYLNEDGILLTGLQKNIPAREQAGEKAAYYFNGSGVMQTGWFRFTENKVYVWKYFGPDGRQIDWEGGKTVTPMNETDKNYKWYQIDDDWYCIQKNATLLKGFYNIGKWRYYFDTKTGILQMGDFLIGTAKYHSDPDTGAINRSGLLLTDQAGKLHYYDGNGKLYSGWINLKSGTVTNRYYFQAGTACSGFSKIGNYYYYFDPDTCALQKNASDKMTGINTSGREVFYYTGKYEYLLSGWQKIKGTWYYFDPVTKEGQVSESVQGKDSYWVSLKGEQYYFLKGTTLAKNWQTIKVGGINGKYYFNSSGVLQKGLFAVGANWYYTNEETGKAEAGLKIFEDGPFKGNTCYFDSNGLMKKGWISTGGKYYYFNANGFLLKGISWIGNVCYLLDPETGERITSSVTIDGKTYYGNNAKGKEGQLLLGLQKQGNKTFYYGTDGQRYTGWQVISGNTYYFKENGEMHTGILNVTETISGGEEGPDQELTHTYYFNGSGIMQKGWIRFSENKTYVWKYFGADGRQIEPDENTFVSPKGEKVAKNPYHWYRVTEPGTEEGTTVQNWYCIYNNTTLLKKCTKIGNWKYLFHAQTGALQRGHFTVGTTAYYSDPETGAINLSGFLYTDEETADRYYYDANGKRTTGWVTIKSGIDAGKYYFNTLTGAAYRGGWYYVDNTHYLFDFWGRVKVTPEISSLAATNYKTVTVKWKKMDGAVRYILEYDRNASFTEPEILTFEGDSILSEEIRDLDPGVRYYFRLKYELDSKNRKEVDTEQNIGEVTDEITPSDAGDNLAEEESIYTSVESVYSAVKNVVVQDEVAPTATSASIQKLELTTLSSGETGIHAEFTVKGRLKSYGGDGNYYFVRVDSYNNKRLSEDLYTVSKDDGVQSGGNFKFTVDLPVSKQYENDTNINAQVVMSKYALAVKSSANGYTLISKGSYVANPEAVAKYTTEYFMPKSKKGIQGARNEWAYDSGTKNTLINVDLAKVVLSKKKAGCVEYVYKGKTYYFDPLTDLRGTVSDFNQDKRDQYGRLRCQVQVTFVLLMSYDQSLVDMIHPSARVRGAAPYYMLNTTSQSSQERLEAVFSYLGEIFGRDDCFVSNWVLGNEVNSCNAWNYKGNLGLSEYVRGYASAFRTLYYGVTQTRPSSRVFISLDNAWNRAVAGYTGKQVLDSFASYIQAENANISWNLAFHPYSAPLTRTEYWNDYSNTTNSVSSPYISMRNLNYLTSYLGTVESKYKKASNSIRLILSEQGWTSSTSGEYAQARAIAQGFYIAQFNKRVDAFIIRAEIDDMEEARSGLLMGLKDRYETKKTAYYVYKYMDTPRVPSTDDSEKIMSEYHFGTGSKQARRFTDAQAIWKMNWAGLVPGYSVGELNKMPYANPE